jgi:hypothetical protein
MIDEGIETRGRVNVDLNDGSVEEVLQRTTRFILRVEIEQRDGNLVASNHSARATMTPVFPTPPLPPIVKTTRFAFAVIVHLPGLSGSKLRSHGRQTDHDSRFSQTAWL